jgi:hypothetical protein
MNDSAPMSPIISGRPRPNPIPIPNLVAGLVCAELVDMGVEDGPVVETDEIVDVVEIAEIVDMVDGPGRAKIVPTGTGKYLLFMQQSVAFSFSQQYWYSPVEGSKLLTHGMRSTSISCP